MSKQIEFIERCKNLGLHDGSLFDWLDRIESLEHQLAERAAEIAGWRLDQKENIDVAFELQKQLNTITAQRDLLKDALEKLFSWVDAYAETSDTEFPAVERLCVEALASLKGE